MTGTIKPENNSHLLVNVHMNHTHKRFRLFFFHCRRRRSRRSRWENKNKNNTVWHFRWYISFMIEVQFLHNDVRVRL